MDWVVLVRPLDAFVRGMFARRSNNIVYNLYSNYCQKNQEKRFENNDRGVG